MLESNAPDGVVIREGVVPDDIELCVEIWVRALEARDGTVDTETVALRVRFAFENTIVRFAVATFPGSGFSVVESARHDPAEALLHFVAVHPDSSGRGVGTALIGDAAAAAKLGGFNSLVLEVLTSNVRAISLYTRLGFVTFGAEFPHPLTGNPMRSYRLALG